MYNTEAVGTCVDRLAARLNEEDQLTDIIALLRRHEDDADVREAIIIVEAMRSVCCTFKELAVRDIKRSLAEFDEEHRRERVFMVELLQRAYRAYPKALGRAPRMATRPYRFRGPRGRSAAAVRVPGAYRRGKVKK